MKRGTDSSTPSAQKGTYKRAKSIQACSNCRRHKVRCDPPSREEITPSLSNSRRCHRCKVLDLTCSFQESDQQSASPTTAASSSSSASPRITSSPSQPLSMSPLAYARTLKAEDLLPTEDHPWGAPPTPGEYDWTATPLLAIHELTRPKVPTHNLPPSIHTDVSIEQVLTPEQIDYLLGIFETRYSPWLNLTLRTDKARSPFLDLVRCMVASRHLDDATRGNVVSRLEKLSEEAYLRQIFNPVPTEESIQALLIFSLWAPVGEVTRQDGRDDRLLAASTVSVAENLSLRKTFDYVIGLKEEYGRIGVTLPPEKRATLPEAKDKARIWVEISNVESLLCLGTERNPTCIRAVPMGNRPGRQFTCPTNTIDNLRTCRLLHFARMLELAEDGIKLKLGEPSNFDTFYKEAMHILSRLTGLHRRILPLPVICHQEKFTFHIMLVIFHVCKLLVLFHLLREVRYAYGNRGQEHVQWYSLQHHGLPIIMDWFRDCTVAAEAALVQLISQPEPQLLGTAPDHIFGMITFAAVFTVIARLSILTSHNIVLSGYSDVTLKLTVELLKQIKHAQKHAELISTCVRLFDEKLAQKQECDTSLRNQANERRYEAAEGGRDVTQDRDPDPSLTWGEEWQYMPGGNCEYDFDFQFDGAMNPSLLLDPEFLNLMGSFSAAPPLNGANGAT